MTDIADAMEQLYRIENALTITSPISEKIRRVYPFFPRTSVQDVDTPCFLNTYWPSEIEFDSALLRTRYTLHPRLLVYDGNADKAAAIANAFIEPIIDAFCANIKLGLSGWTVLALRFNGEQPRVFEPESEAGGRTFLGLDFFVDVVHNAGKEFQVGAPPP